MAKPSRAVTIQSMPKMAESSSSSSGRSSNPSQEHGVRVVPNNEHRAAADCLAEAFRDDDVAKYFVRTPDTQTWSDSKRWEMHLKIMRSLVLAHCYKGLALTVGPHHEAVALWMPPGKTMEDRFTLFRSGLALLNWRLSREGNHRFTKEFLPLLHRTKSEILGDLDNNSWYLVYIGTKPAARGKGYAKMLIEHVTRQADASGHVCYLESSNDINPAIYRKFGFETVKKIQLTRGAKPIDLDVMLRQPVSRVRPQDVHGMDHHSQTMKMTQTSAKIGDNSH